MTHPTHNLSSERNALDAGMLEQLASSERLAELGRISAGIVHELNTPLSVIASAAQLILREDELPPFTREMVERIGEEAHRLSGMVRGVLTFVRQDERQEGESDLSQVVREVLALLHYEARKRSVAVVEELDFTLPSVAVESNVLKQILINLVMNALQAMSDGGTLHLRTFLDLDRRPTLSVADTGCGIPPDRLGRIFEPFYTTKSAGEGTGLGLFVTARLLEAAGGEITVSSVAGEGTTFMVTVPSVD
ncbi:sensor histidine kinase [Geobacter argillaceus]|uniref:histidine kinase n=1 Tax=Geobacter argillaceus TaxID=345631 RepID=A0A562W895_9BACT|nr:ATP-binding protein [Geobacter argillaceus]TWJ26509.1 two-component system NtrC family sensor kinase [Geobacter argillaceus]